MASEPRELPKTNASGEDQEIILSPFRYQFPTPGELALLRDKASLTKKDVAERMPVNRHTVRKWETGESSPRLDQLQQLLGLYRVEIVDN